MWYTAWVHLPTSPGRGHGGGSEHRKISLSTKGQNGALGTMSASSFPPPTCYTLLLPLFRAKQFTSLAKFFPVLTGNVFIGYVRIFKSDAEDVKKLNKLTLTVTGESTR